MAIYLSFAQQRLEKVKSDIKFKYTIKLLKFPIFPSHLRKFIQSQ